jgi:acetyl-CoA C-acetyltransferase
MEHDQNVLVLSAVRTAIGKYGGGLAAVPPDRTNPNGSGISLGHPVGATGAILTVKALYELHRTGGRYALVTMCIGGGQGIAAIFERL